MEDNLLTLPQVRELLMVSYNTLNRYIKDGKIPVIRISKAKRFIRQQDLEKFLSKHRVVADTTEGQQWQRQP